jgi:putative FmdB family regulatory protein
MPIYEFYCESCHTVFNFFSQRVNRETRPNCPKCDCSNLERKVSVFLVSRNRSKQGSDPFEGIDESGLEQAIMSMTSEFEKLDQENPQQVAGAMRKVMHQAGIELGDGMEEVIGRLEAGDSSDQIDATLENSFDDDANLI